MSYDIVMLPCEGGDDRARSTARAANVRDRSPVRQRRRSRLLDALQLRLADLREQPVRGASRPTAAVAGQQADDYNNATASRACSSTTFPKGMAFAQWLIAAGARDVAAGPAQHRSGPPRHLGGAGLRAELDQLRLPGDSAIETRTRARRHAPDVQHAARSRRPTTWAIRSTAAARCSATSTSPPNALKTAPGKTFPGACVTPLHAERSGEGAGLHAVRSVVLRAVRYDDPDLVNLPGPTPTSAPLPTPLVPSPASSRTASRWRPA